jgi:hypothetical protein
MAEVKDYIDITPPGVDPLGQRTGGSKGKTTTVFQEEEKKHILYNPSGLTREGVEEKIRQWKNSNNAHVRIKYQSMLKNCKLLTSSGLTTEGDIILGRAKDGSPTWTKPNDKPVPTKVIPTTTNKIR